MIPSIYISCLDGWLGHPNVEALPAHNSKRRVELLVGGIQQLSALCRRRYVNTFETCKNRLEAVWAQPKAPESPEIGIEGADSSMG